MSRRSTVLVLVAILLLSTNLRPAAVSVGPVLAELRDGLGMGPASAGLLTSLPVLAFAVFGALAPTAAARLGPHRVTLLALLAVVVGLAGRAVVRQESAFLALSVVAVAGMAMANVLIPSLVRLHFPDRIGLLTALYTTALAVGLTASFLLTVPVANAFGGWRYGIGIWAVLAAVAALPWFGLVRHDQRLDAPVRDVGYGDIARTRMGWAMTFFFGLQSLMAYAVFGWFATLWRDAGFGAGTASALVGIVASVSIPLSLWAPQVVARPGDQRWVLVLIMSCYPVAYVGLIVAPHALAVLWALVLGTALVTFPIVLTLVGLRTRTAGATAALSGWTQSTGYLMAALGPFGVGVLHDATGGWTAPLLVLTALSVPLFAVGLYVGKPAHIEDQLRRRAELPTGA
ncbi:MAG: transporter, family, cyanate transporter [Nocardioidaceae bacterium]|nr:transporter, family, cyanate transporter [Nocardioidaceae bacterium]